MGGEHEADAIRTETAMRTHLPHPATVIVQILLAAWVWVALSREIQPFQGWWV